MTEDNINTLIYTIGIVAILWIFRKPIIDFFSRMYLVKWGSGELRATQRKDLRDALAPSQKEGSKKQPSEEQNIFHSPMIKKKVKEIKAEFDAMEHQNETDKVNLLINRLSDAHMRIIFERLYCAILGCEIKLLKVLNSYRSPEGWAKEDIDSHSVIRNSSRSAEKSVNLLIYFFLMKIENNSYHITDIGIDFLAWLTVEGRPENKRT